MLEPRFEKRRTILVDELDELNEIIFVNKGIVLIGYEINKQKLYSIRYKNNCIVGAYGVTFNQRASFIYTSQTDIHGYSIRKQNWFYLLQNNREISDVLKGNILMNYMMSIRGKVIVRKKKALA